VFNPSMFIQYNPPMPEYGIHCVYVQPSPH
jgi:hypothetical protein